MHHVLILDLGGSAIHAQISPSNHNDLVHSYDTVDCLAFQNVTACQPLSPLYPNSLPHMRARHRLKPSTIGCAVFIFGISSMALPGRQLRSSTTFAEAFQSLFLHLLIGPNALPSPLKLYPSLPSLLTLRPHSIVRSAPSPWWLSGHAAG
jgi:hypothetical protein